MEFSLDAYQIEVVHCAPQAALIIKYRSTETTAAADLEVRLPEVFALARKLKIQTTGPAFSWFSDRNGPEFEVRAGMPILATEQIAAPLGSDLEVCHLPGGSAFSLTHVGPYDGLAIAHRTLASWAREQDVDLLGGPWEVYRSDPILNPEQARWRTQLFQVFEQRKATAK